MRRLTNYISLYAIYPCFWLLWLVCCYPHTTDTLQCHKRPPIHQPTGSSLNTKQLGHFRYRYHRSPTIKARVHVWKISVASDSDILWKISEIINLSERFLRHGTLPTIFLNHRCNHRLKSFVKHFSPRSTVRWNLIFQFPFTWARAFRV